MHSASSDDSDDGSSVSTYECRHWPDFTDMNSDCDSIDSDDERYYRPAYFGDGWIGIRLDLGDTDWNHIGDWIAKSWRAVAPKKLTKLMDVAGEF